VKWIARRQCHVASRRFDNAQAVSTQILPRVVEMVPEGHFSTAFSARGHDYLSDLVWMLIMQPLAFRDAVDRRI
jgi:hypothetical protein